MGCKTGCFKTFSRSTLLTVTTKNNQQVNKWWVEKEPGNEILARDFRIIIGRYMYMYMYICIQCRHTQNYGYCTSNVSVNDSSLPSSLFTS